MILPISSSEGSDFGIMSDLAKFLSTPEGSIVD
jgi:hypothetical protein